MQRILAKEALRAAFIDLELFAGQGGENVHGEFGGVKDWSEPSTRPLQAARLADGSRPRSVMDSAAPHGIDASAACSLHTQPRSSRPAARAHRLDAARAHRCDAATLC